MKKNWFKISAITLVSIGAVYGGYRLVKYLIDKSREEIVPTEEEVKVADLAEKKEAEKPTFNGAKIVKMGSKGEEAKTVQKTLNNIISDAKRGITPTVTKTIIPEFDWSTGKNASYTSSNQKPYLDIQFDSIKEARRKKVASLKPLIVDGNFGAKSVAVLIEIMGKSSASYNEVRDKRIAFANVYGLGNPYKK